MLLNTLKVTGVGALFGAGTTLGAYYLVSTLLVTATFLSVAGIGLVSFFTGVIAYNALPLIFDAE
jgi:hypothetical protein